MRRNMENLEQLGIKIWKNEAEFRRRQERNKFHHRPVSLAYPQTFGLKWRQQNIFWVVVSRQALLLDFLNKITISALTSEREHLTCEKSFNCWEKSNKFDLGEMKIEESTRIKKLFDRSLSSMSLKKTSAFVMWT